jgi:hypothetical protein
MPMLLKTLQKKTMHQTMKHLRNKRIFIVLFIVFCTALLAYFAFPKKAKQPTQQIWIESDYAGYLSVQSVFDKTKNSLLNPWISNNGISVLFAILKENGLDFDKPWPFFVDIETQSYYIALPIKDSARFDKSMQSYLSNQTRLPNEWQLLVNKNFQYRRLRNMALFYFNKQRNPPIANIQWVDASKTNESYLFYCSATEPYKKQKQLSCLQLAVKATDSLQISLAIASTQLNLLRLNKQAWSIDQCDETNFLSLSFDTASVRSFVALFQPEIRCLFSQNEAMIDLFLDAWKGDLLLQLGTEKKSVQSEIVTEMDENFNLSEKKIEREVTYKNDILALSVNQKWSSFENAITSRHPNVNQEKTLTQSMNAKKNEPQCNALPFFAPSIHSTDAGIKKSLRLKDLNLSKKQGFVIFHGAPNSPKLIKSNSPRLSFRFNQWFFSLDEANGKRLTVQMVIAD